MKSLKSKLKNIAHERMARHLGMEANLIPACSIYDTFLVNDELDLLELRFQILYPFVSKFVVVESSKTFSGKNKPCYYSENSQRFEKFRDKVVHIVLDNVPDIAYEDNPNNPDSLVSEFWQRNQIMQGIRSVADGDWILISDVDEIPNPRILARIADQGPKDRQIILRQDWRLFFFDLKVKDHYWLGTHMLTRGALRYRYNDTPNKCWEKRWFKNDEVHANNGGWHLSYMGGSDAIKSKFLSCGHPLKCSRYINNLASFKLDGKYEFYHHGIEGLISEMVESVNSNDRLKFDPDHYQQTVASLQEDPQVSCILKV